MSDTLRPMPGLQNVINLRAVVAADTVDKAEAVQAGLATLLRDVGTIRTSEPQSYGWKYPGHHQFRLDILPFAVADEAYIELQRRIGTDWTGGDNVPDGGAIWKRSDSNECFSALIAWISIEPATEPISTSRLDFFEKVWISSADPKKVSINGQLGFVAGKAFDEDGQWSYSVFVYVHSVCWGCSDEELISTGEFDREHQSKSREWIRVSRDGKLLE